MRGASHIKKMKSHEEFYSRSEDNSVFLGKRLPDCIEGAVNISN